MPILFIISQAAKGTLMALVRRPRDTVDFIR